MAGIKSVETALYETNAYNFLSFVKKYGVFVSRGNAGAVLEVKSVLKEIGNMRQKDMTDQHTLLLDALNEADKKGSEYLMVRKK